jgi:hypothetical protein
MNITVNPIVSTDSLSLTSQIIIRSVLFIYIILGLIGNILNIFLFTSPALSRTSSSLYLLSTSITDLFVTIFVIPFYLATDGFNQDITYNSLLACKLVSYINYVGLGLPPFFTVLACADRWAASCVQVNRRRFASARTAKRLIPLSIILCCLLYSYILVLYTHDPNPPPPYCSVNSSYAVFALSFNLIIYSLVPPFLMALFSIGIILNVIRKQNRIMPAVQVLNTSINTGPIQRNRRRLNQMQIMLVCQAIAECILTLPFSVINLISILVDNNEYFLSIYSFIRLFIFINYVSSFYLYILSSKLYRDELKKLVQRIYNRR